MSGETKRRFPPETRTLQLIAVVILFASSIASLVWTVVVFVDREARRNSAGRILSEASNRMIQAGSAELTRMIPRWPAEVADEHWLIINRRLAELTDSILRDYPGVEGGYFSEYGKKFVGFAFPTEPLPVAEKNSKRRIPARSGPPEREFDLIEIRVNAAIRKNKVLFGVESVPPSTVAVRTAPVYYEGAIVGAAWTMMRIEDPLFVRTSTRGYLLASGFALAGIVLSLVMTIGLARTVRKQAVERNRLQTELRRNERLAALGKLLAGVAHEVRNPLAGIRSTAQLWQRGIGPDSESAGDLIAEVDRLEAIVSRLLQFSRAETSELAPGDLNAVVAEAARLAQGPAELEGVNVEVELEPGLPAAAMAPQALIQVFRNLTTNALQVSPPGSSIRLTTKVEPGGRRLLASVRDQGPGLSPDVLRHLFEPFYTTKSEGTGLGLAIAREIALAHRGDLKAENRTDSRGASFTLVLPVVAAETPAEKKVDAVFT